MLAVLEEHALEYVVIGGVGAVLWGSPRNTDDLDICPARDRRNLGRLAASLNELEARVRPPGLAEGFDAPAAWDERSFDAFVSIALVTRLGWLDVWFTPDGTGGYPDLAARAASAELGGVSVKVADLDDIIRSKVASGREKDLAALPHLRELQERRRRP